MAAMSLLTPDLAASLAATALANVAREYPNHPGHVLAGPDDLLAPHELHPAFHGSYDWHSSVHMHWLLARLRRLFPGLPQRAEIAATFERHFAPPPIAAECAYFARPQALTFERTYGWAWLLELATELARDRDAAAHDAHAALAPLVAIVIDRYRAYLPRQRYPLRQGLHPNSAFGLAFALDHADAAGDGAFRALCAATARRWFAADREVPAAWEPSGADFLSPALIEADLMRRVLPPPAFGAWLSAFLPGIADGVPASLFEPAIVDDRADPLLVHLDGLNLSRAWCMTGIAAALGPDDPRHDRLRHAAERHRDAGLAGLSSGEYAGEHWLATFAVLALTE